MWLRIWSFIYYFVLLEKFELPYQKIRTYKTGIMQNTETQVEKWLNSMGKYYKIAADEWCRFLFGHMADKPGICQISD